MHNMYEQFYRFLSELIIKFFKQNNIKAGAKYDIRLPNESEVIGLYEQLAQLKEAEIFRYQMPNQTPYETKCLKVGNIKLIIATTAAQVTDAFLTNLRNKVGTDEVLFKDTAILFIHDSRLDSILNGSESMQKVGMPLHTTCIEQVIQEKLNTGNYSKEVKRIVQFVLENKRGVQIDVRNAIIEYREILAVLESGQVRAQDYNEFSLFYDSTLQTLNDKEAKQQLQENAKCYKLIFDYHHFNMKESILEKSFDKKGITLINGGYWKDIDFNDLKRSIERKNSTEPIVYLPNEIKKTEEGLTYWEACDKDTAKGRRTLNLIIFNPEALSEVQLKLRFNQHLKQISCQMDAKSDMTFETKGKQLILKMQGSKQFISFGKIKYKDVKDYEFRILMIPAEERIFIDLKTSYKLPSKYVKRGIYLEREEISFKLNPESNKIENYGIKSFKEEIQCELDTGYWITQEVENPEAEIIELDVQIADVQVPIYVKGEAIKPKVITASKIYKLKQELQVDFIYDYNEELQMLRLYQATQQYYVVEELLELLKFEIEFIQKEALYLEQNDRYHTEESQVNIDETIKTTYSNLIQYFKKHQTVPSLAYLNEELCLLMKQYLKSYLRVIKEIEDGSILSDSQKDLNKLGVINCIWKQQIYWSPLHPINIAYELQRHQYLKDEEIDEQILRKIKPFGLVNYIKNDEDDLYKSKETTGMMWLKFIPIEVQGAEEKNEMAKIVEKNIISFISEFQYLFKTSRQLPLRINLVNIGEGQEILGGLFRYINSALKVQKVDEIIPVELRIYNKGKTKSVFHEMSYDTKALDQISERFELNYESYDLTLSEYIKVFRQKINIYQLVDEQTYCKCHLCFIGNDDIEKVTFRNIKEIPANLYLGGMITAPTIYKEYQSYVKSSGLLGMEENTLTETIQAVNAMSYVGNSNTPYDSSSVLATLVEEQAIDCTKSAREQSVWTVYLEPTVTFNYFIKQKCNIHYVERLYSPNSLDAITISDDVDFYQMVVENKIEALGLNREEDNIKAMIALGNIINGEWLLNLISTKRNTGIESLHNAPIIAWISHLLEQTDYMWIPVSLYELMKTCRDVGIKSKKGLLKSKTYERLINDLVWVGFKQVKEQIEVIFYPSTIRKNANEEGVYKLLKENLYEESFSGAYIRQILIQRALLNLEQLVEKGLFEHELVHIFLGQEVKNQLCQEQYNLIQSINEILGTELNIIFSEVEEIKVEHQAGNLVAYINKKLLWKNEFNVQEIKDFQKIESLEEVPVIKSAEEVKVEQATKNEENQIEEDLEYILPEGRYSVLVYHKQIPKYMIERIQFYMKRGIKLYLLLGTDEVSFREVVGDHYEYFQEYVRKQIVNINYNIQLEVDEVYKVDGEIQDEVLWKALEATNFNCEQYAIEHQSIQEHLSVSAGAGTGKTKVMIDRIMFIKHMKPALALSEIAMITFTNESTMEMRTRLSNRLSAYYEMTQNIKYLKWMDELSNMQISTIHAFSMELLKQIGDEIGIINLQIGSYKREKEDLIEKAIDSYSKVYREEYQNFRYIEQYKIKKLIMEVMNFLDQRSILLDETALKIDFGHSNNGYHHLFQYVIQEVNQQLENLKFETGKYEVNDLIKMLRQMTKVEKINSKVKFSYLMVDEFQDTDEVQVSFIAWLAERLKAVLFVVGDVKQSIYRFRGADYTAFKQLKEASSFEFLEQHISKNYRTDRGLMTCLNKTFAALSEEVDCFEFDKTSWLQATKGSKEEVGFHLERIKQEDSKFAKVRDLYVQRKDKGSVCVLCRTNYEVNEMVQRLETMQIPCIAEVKGSFYRQPAIRDFYLLIRALLHQERYDEWVLLEQSVYGKQELTPIKVVNNYATDRNYTKALVQQTKWYQELKQILMEKEGYPIIKVLRELIEIYKPHIEYGKRYLSNLLKEGMDTPEELKKIAAYKAAEYETNLNHLLFVLQRDFSDATLSLYRIEEFLKRMIATDQIQDIISSQVNHEIHAVRVMTVHKAKGLEFDTVIIPYTDKKFINYRRNQYMISREQDGYKLGYRIYSKEKNLTSTNTGYSVLEDQEEKELIGDETRLFYVACTRARHHLYVFINEFTYKNRKISSWQDLAIRGE